MQPRGPWVRKPLSLVFQEEASAASNDSNTQNHQRHLSLLDMVSIGVGGTVGSGIFVLAGSIAHQYAGPATFLSFLISGMAACCSGLCYAEFAGKLPAAGSTYLYAHVTLGELPATLAAACLTLEYAVSGAAVARSWGDKVVEYLVVQCQWDGLPFLLGTSSANDENGASSSINLLAGLVSAASVGILACGVQESKSVTNFFTVLKLLLVLFMIVGGFLLFQPVNMTPLAPFGWSAVVRGATSSFFAFLGYDEVCCLASEAKNPADMSKAILYTLATVTLVYILASVALVGMMPYQDISPTSGFPTAFLDRGVVWAAHLTAAGEVITLPVVVLISLLAQPRLFAAMAMDGLLPLIFARRDENGNLFWSTLLSGIPMIFLATFVPFAILDDGISVGILIAFNITNSCLILMKCQPPPSQRPRWLSQGLVFFHILSFANGIAFRIGSMDWLPTLTVSATVLMALFLHAHTDVQSNFGGHLWEELGVSSMVPSSTTSSPANGGASFETPMVPFLPLLGIAMNWFLIAQLEWSGLGVLFAYLSAVSFVYFYFTRRCYGDNRGPIRRVGPSTLHSSPMDDHSEGISLVSM
eukprot:Nitzschia sp. Nitz4//scaffold59_size112058//76992//78864//NITZ4_004119-RA/size112058-snap-gene-0.37-mRNA-1//1//CDS//3329555153//5789//frame0